MKSFIAALLVAVLGFGATVAWAHGDAASRGVDAGTRASPVVHPAEASSPKEGKRATSPKASEKFRRAAPTPVFCACRPLDDHA